MCNSYNTIIFSSRPTAIVFVVNIFVVLISFSITCPTHSLLTSQHGLITLKFPLDKSTIATHLRFRNNKNSNPNVIIIHTVSMRLQSSSQQPPKEKSDRSNNSKDEQKELTLYEILGTSQTATRSELKSQYITLAKKSHPDAQLGKEKEGIDDETVDFQEIAEAWRTLGNPKSRRKYDRELKAKEWGEKAQRLTNERLEQAAPVAMKIMDNIAVPFLRRTTATTWAVGKAIATGLSSSSTRTIIKNDDNDDDENTNVTNSDSNSASIIINNVENSETDDDQVVDDAASNASTLKNATETLADTLISAIEAGKKAGRTVDTFELNEKSLELQVRAKNEEEKAKHVIEELDSVKEKRLFATLQSTEFALSSEEAKEVLKKLHTDDNFTFANRSMKKTVIEKEIHSLRNTEIQFTEKLDFYTEIDREWNELLIKREKAKENLSIKKNTEIEAQRALDNAHKMAIEAKDDMVEVSSTLRGVEQDVRKRAQEMDRVSTTLSRKQERVRNALRRKTELLNGGIQVQYITEQEVMMLRKKEIQLIGEAREIATMVSRLQSRADRLKKRADALEQWKS
mmetsp:Transcript_67286/g.75384  ORF Transcript_67286/g.75384 Transcript_67286/m.75384 type:complete len:570 (+) Transcript_67286:55-1764(+)